METSYIKLNSSNFVESFAIIMKVIHENKITMVTEGTMNLQGMGPLKTIVRTWENGGPHHCHEGHADSMGKNLLLQIEAEYSDERVLAAIRVALALEGRNLQQQNSCSEDGVMKYFVG